MDTSPQGAAGPRSSEKTMSQTETVMQGTVTPDGALVLADRLDLPPGRVRVVIQSLPDLADDPFWQRMEAIRAGQAARGHVPRSVEEVESDRRAMREEMEEEIQEALRLQEECRQARASGDSVEEPND